MNLGETIVYFRKKRKMTQGALAIEAKISQPYLSMIEGNKTSTNLETLTVIADKLGIPIELLMMHSLSVKKIPEAKKEAYYRIMPLLHEIMEEYFLIDETEVKK